MKNKFNIYIYLFITYCQILGLYLILKSETEIRMRILGVILLTISTIFLISLSLISLKKSLKIPKDIPNIYYNFEDLDFIFVDTKCFLKLEDNKGESAFYKKTKTVKAVKDNVSSYSEQGVWAEGTIKKPNVSINGIPYPLKISDMEKEFRVKFKHPLKKNEVKNIEMSWYIINSFKSHIEYFTTNFTKPVRNFQLIIEFPLDRIFTDAWVDFTFDGQKITIAEKYYEIIKDNNKIILNISYPIPNMKSILFWEW